ncbi:hypothetical protein GEV27_12025 [Aeromicrobium sp. S22]|nr:hypothetical protein [Aeromicrobium sp. S22]
MTITSGWRGSRPGEMRCGPEPESSVGRSDRTYASAMRLRLVPAAAVTAALLLIALLGSPGAASSSERDAKASISGTVTGYGLDHGDWVDVVAYPLAPSGTQRGTHVVPAGTFTMYLEPGEYRVMFYSSRAGESAWEFFGGGHTTADAKIVTVAPGQKITGIDATLERAGTIEGEIILPPGIPDGDPVGSVVAQSRDGSTWLDNPNGVWSVDSDGRTFRLGGLPAGTYRLRFVNKNGGTITPLDVATGYLGGTDDPEEATPVRVEAGETTRVDLPVRRGAHIRGKVTDASGRPVPRTTVTALYTRPGDIPFNTQSYYATTDDNGEYEVRSLSKGTYVLRFGPPDPYEAVFSGGAYGKFLSGWDAGPDVPDDARRITVDAGDVATEDVIVREGGSLQGTVRDSTGLPLPGILVMAGPAHPQGQTQVTDALGRYRFVGRPRTKYLMTFTDPSGVYATRHQEGFSPRDARTWTPVEVETTVDLDVVMRPPLPVVSDAEPTYGEVIEARLTSGDQTPQAGASWLWRRDGKTIPGATGRTYRVTKADHRARLSVTYRPRRGGASLSFMSRATSRVATTKPRVTATSSSRHHRTVRLRIAVKAKSVSTSLLDGRVQVARRGAGGDAVYTRAIKNGRLNLTLRDQPRGRQTYRVRFLKAPETFAASATTRASARVR